MPFQIIRGNLDSVLCDAVVVTAAGQRNHAGHDESQTIRVGKHRLSKTRNGSLPYVIHNPIPNKLNAFTGPFLVRHGYRRAFRIVSNYHFKRVAFPLIGSECDGLPKEAALEIASHEIKRFLADHVNTTIILVISNLDTFRPDPAILSGLSEHLLYIEEQERQKKELRMMLDMISTGPLPVITPEDVQEDRRNAQSTYAFPQDPEPGTPQISQRNVLYLHREIQNQCNTVDTEEKPESVLLFEAFMRERGEKLDESFSQMVIRKIDEKGYRKDSDCYCKANIDRRLFSRIRCEENYHPKKTTAVAMAIALELTLEETNELLRKAGYSLSQSILFDTIIEYCILHHYYDIYDVNKLLFVYNQPLLGS